MTLRDRDREIIRRVLTHRDRDREGKIGQPDCNFPTPRDPGYGGCHALRSSISAVYEQQFSAVYNQFLSSLAEVSQNSLSRTHSTLSILHQTVGAQNMYFVLLDKN